MVPTRVHGRYALYETLGVGAAATVHLGVARGREVVPVAIKRLHDRHAREAVAVARLLDEVRLSRHVIHPNVVRVIDFVSDGEEMLAVMEYVHGEPLSRLLADVKRSGGHTPVAIAASIACDVLRGLYAAHIATDHEGRALDLVHRDVTPENILVGVDGMARLMDFGVAKAEGRLHATKDGGVKGKLAYLAPEQVGGDVTSRTDLYAAGLVLWEVLVGERVIDGESEPELLMKALEPTIVAPSTRVPGVPASLDAVILRALCKDPEGRYATGTEQAEAIEAALGGVASATDVAEWVRFHAGMRLAEREDSVHAMLAAEEAAMAPPPHESTASDGVLVSAPRETRTRGFALMALATLAVVALFFVWPRSSSSSPSSLPDPAAAAASPDPPPLSPVPVPVPVPVPDPTSPPPLSIAPPSARAATSPLAPRPRPPAHSAPPSCDPPWYLDAKGIRRYDPACVK